MGTLFWSHWFLNPPLTLLPLIDASCRNTLSIDGTSGTTLVLTADVPILVDPRDRANHFSSDYIVYNCVRVETVIADLMGGDGQGDSGVSCYRVNHFCSGSLSLSMNYLQILMVSCALARKTTSMFTPMVPPSFTLMVTLLLTPMFALTAT